MVFNFESEVAYNINFRSAVQAKRLINPMKWQKNEDNTNNYNWTISKWGDHHYVWIEKDQVWLQVELVRRFMASHSPSSTADHTRNKQDGRINFNKLSLI